MPAAPRARLSVHEHKLGAWSRARRAPHAGLAGVVVREPLGYQHSRVVFDAWLEPPRPELTMMIDLDGWISADGRRELTGACVSLEDLFGSGGRRLTERLRSLSDWDERFDVMEDFLLARVAQGPAVDPGVAWAWQRLQDTGGRVRIEALARELGASRRYLARRFDEQVGLSPKSVGRLQRFADVRRRIERSPSRWATIAYEVGYADQSHLNREFQQFAGTTPKDFVARLIPGGGVIGDGCDVADR